MADDKKDSGGGDKNGGGSSNDYIGGEGEGDIKDPRISGSDADIDTLTYEQILYLIAGIGKDFHALLEKGSKTDGWLKFVQGQAKDGDSVKEDKAKGTDGSVAISYTAFQEHVFFKVNYNDNLIDSWGKSVADTESYMTALAKGKVGQIDAGQFTTAKNMVDHYQKWLEDSANNTAAYLKSIDSPDSEFKGRAAYAIQGNVKHLHQILQKLQLQLNLRGTSAALANLSTAVTKFGHDMAKIWTDAHGDMTTVLNRAIAQYVNNVRHYIRGIGIVRGEPNYVLDYVAEYGSRGDVADIDCIKYVNQVLSTYDSWRHDQYVGFERRGQRLNNPDNKYSGYEDYNTTGGHLVWDAPPELPGGNSISGADLRTATVWNEMNRQISNYVLNNVLKPMEKEARVAAHNLADAYKKAKPHLRALTVVNPVTIGNAPPGGGPGGGPGGDDGGGDHKPPPFDLGGGDGGNNKPPPFDPGGGDGGNNKPPPFDPGGGDGGNNKPPPFDLGGGDGGNNKPPPFDPGGGDGGPNDRVNSKIVDPNGNLSDPDDPFVKDPNGQGDGAPPPFGPFGGGPGDGPGSNGRSREYRNPGGDDGGGDNGGGDNGGGDTGGNGWSPEDPWDRINKELGNNHPGGDDGGDDGFGGDKNHIPGDDSPREHKNPGGDDGWSPDDPWDRINKELGNNHPGGGDGNLNVPPPGGGHGPGDMGGELGGGGHGPGGMGGELGGGHGGGGAGAGPGGGGSGSGPGGSGAGSGFAGEGWSDWSGQLGGGGGSGGGGGGGNGQGPGAGMPMMPPMGGMGGGMGGMGGMGGGGAGGRERERQTWLSEDEEVWGADVDLGGGVIGRPDGGPRITDDVPLPTHVHTPGKAGKGRRDKADKRTTTGAEATESAEPVGSEANPVEAAESVEQVKAESPGETRRAERTRAEGSA